MWGKKYEENLVELIKCSKPFKVLAGEEVSLV